MKTLHFSKSSRLEWAKYHPWQLWQPEKTQNSVYVLIYEECTLTLEKWRQPEENNEILASLQMPWESRERACSAQQHQACDKMLPPGGQVLGLAADKGAAPTFPDGKLIHSRNEGEGMCLGALLLTHWIQALVSGNNQLSVKETRRDAHARAAVTFFRTLRIEPRRVQRLSSLQGKIRVKDWLCYKKCQCTEQTDG